MQKSVLLQPIPINLFSMWPVFGLRPVAKFGVKHSNVNLYWHRKSPFPSPERWRKIYPIIIHIKEKSDSKFALKCIKMFHKRTPKSPTSQTTYLNKNGYKNQECKSFFLFPILKGLLCYFLKPKKDIKLTILMPNCLKFCQIQVFGFATSQKKVQNRILKLAWS